MVTIKIARASGSLKALTELMRAGLISKLTDSKEISFLSVFACPFKMSRFIYH